MPPEVTTMTGTEGMAVVALITQTVASATETITLTGMTEWSMESELAVIKAAVG